MILKPRPFRKPNLSHPLSKGLVGCWLMNEGSGSHVNDLSGSNNATCTNTAWVGGKTGSAIYADATDNIALDSTIAFGAADNWTVVFWAKKNSASQTAGQLISDNTSDDNDYIWLFRDVGFYFYNSSGYFANSTADKAYDSVWKQYAVRSVGGIITFFTNGANRGGSTIAGGNGGGSFNIANIVSSNKGLTYAGDIDHVGIYNRALVDSEIQQLYIDPFCVFGRRNIAKLYVAAGVPSSIVVLRRRIEAA